MQLIYIYIYIYTHTHCVYAKLANTLFVYYFYGGCKWICQTNDWTKQDTIRITIRGFGAEQWLPRKHRMHESGNIGVPLLPDLSWTRLDPWRNKAFKPFLSNHTLARQYWWPAGPPARSLGWLSSSARNISSQHWWLYAGRD